MLNDLDSDRCIELGLDPKVVRRLAARIQRCATDANRLGLIIFGGAGSGSLRKNGGGSQNDVAYLGQRFDGGDGGDVF